MIKYKSFLYLSIGINTVLFLLISSFRIHQESFETSDRVMALAAIDMKENSRDKKSSIQSKLNRNPVFKKPINESIDAIMEQIETIDNVIHGISIVAFSQTTQSEMNRIFRQNQHLETLQHILHAGEAQLRIIYKETCADLNKYTDETYSAAMISNVIQSIPKLTILDKIQRLKGCSIVNAKTIISSLKLDIRNLEYLYVTEIIKLFPIEKEPVSRPMAFVNSQKAVYAPTDTIKAEISIGKVLKFKNTTYAVNGQKVVPDENGIAPFEETAWQTGKRRIKMVKDVRSTLTGESFSGSSEFEYLVVN